MFSQKEAVFTVVTKFYGNKFVNGVEPTKEEREKLIDLLIESHKKGEWMIKNSQEDIKRYVRGLLNNHLTKDIRLNGGEKYVPENPGQRVMSGSPEIKAIRQLLTTLKEGTAGYATAKKELDARVEALQAEKSKAKIDIDNLPENLRALVG